MNEYYLWPTKAQAGAALANINANPAFPIQGKNAATGELVDSWTTCWVEATVQTIDGKWGFPRVPAEILDRMGVTEAQRAAWLAAFAPEIVADPVFPSPPPEQL
jgi:hypothetical protein